LNSRQQDRPSGDITNEAFVRFEFSRGQAKLYQTDRRSEMTNDEIPKDERMTKLE
jgi:hypothetical protein